MAALQVGGDAGMDRVVVEGTDRCGFGPSKDVGTGLLG